MSHDEAEDPRRRWLIKALAAGVFSSALPDKLALAGFFGSEPGRMPSGQSIYRITGTVKVNGKQATMQTPIKPGDTVETGNNSELIFVINGNHSMILRANSHLVIQAGHRAAPPAGPKTSQQSKVAIEDEKQRPTAAVQERQAAQPQSGSFGDLVISGLHMLSGKLLSVSRNSPMEVNTVNATIGIRGTGFYVESNPGETYFCTCYGTTDVASQSDPSSRETITSMHSHHPVYIVNDGGAGKQIRSAPFINHTDQELALVEALVGRVPPFIFPKDDYTAPRRDY